MVVVMTDGVSDRRDLTKELDLLAENVIRMLEENDAKIYSREVIEEFRNPSNIGRMQDADGEGVGDGICGDSMEIYLKIKDGVIERCTFFTDGCGATIACGSRLTRFVKGMSVEGAKAVKPASLIHLLNGLPEEHVHCASLAVVALKGAIRNYESRQRAKEGARA
ncbi:MAG: iron-sulfur cluster assembly scaffold protein [Candidatus Thermoplasmatota archaeon]|nr:iron-sulfur cluster assembly scaffold protein [Candidatus Thermoplasmatota archaeon]